MATKKLVPRATNEGGLGTAAKVWGDSWLYNLTVTDLDVSTSTSGVVEDNGLLGKRDLTTVGIDVQDTEDATCWVGLWEDATGTLLPKTDEMLTYNALLNILKVGDNTINTSYYANNILAKGAPFNIRSTNDTVTLSASSEVTVHSDANDINFTTGGTPAQVGHLSSLGLIINNLPAAVSPTKILVESTTVAGLVSHLAMSSIVPNLQTLDEGSSLTATTQSINYVGSGVTTTASGNAVTVEIAGDPNVLDTEVATCFVGLYEAATGVLLPKTDEALTYDALTNILSVGSSSINTSYYANNILAKGAPFSLRSTNNTASISANLGMTIHDDSDDISFLTGGTPVQVGKLTSAGLFIDNIPSEAAPINIIVDNSATPGLFSKMALSALPTQLITVQDTEDAGCFVGLFEAATGNLAPKTDEALTYNALTDTLAIGAASPLKITTSQITSTLDFIIRADNLSALKLSSTHGSIYFEGINNNITAHLDDTGLEIYNIPTEASPTHVLVNNIATPGLVSQATIASIVPTTTPVTDTNDDTCFVGLWPDAAGNLTAHTDAELKYNAIAKTFEVGNILINNSTSTQICLDIEAANTTANIIDVNGQELTSGTGMYMDFNSLDVGHAIDIDVTQATPDVSIVNRGHYNYLYTKTGSSGSGVTNKPWGARYYLTDSSSNNVGAETGLNGIYIKTKYTVNSGEILQNGITLDIGDDGVGDTGLKTTGIDLTVLDGGTDIVMRSHADSGDMCTIATTTNGATTIKTIDDNAVAAHITVDADGSIDFKKTSVLQATVESLRTESFLLGVSDETSSLTVGDAKTTFRIPYAFTLTDIRINCNTAPTGAAITVNISDDGTSIFDDGANNGVRPTIAATAKTSVGGTAHAFAQGGAAATATVDIADDSEITVDIDVIGSTLAGKGLKVTLIGYKTV
tara:strand:- start:270 stop:3035 length:2766 start_codon:yes stop_codon:yes gene_type:complete